MTRETYNRIHRVLLSVMMSLMAWLIVKTFIVDVPFYLYFIIEVIIGIGEFFSNFIRKKAGIEASVTKNKPTKI